jgi:hypothetical protein
VVAVGNEAQRQRETREEQRPCVQVGDRAPAREADAGHAMVEVLAVGPVYRLLVLQPLEHDERRVQERDGEQDQRQHQGHDGGRLDGRLDGDHAHQQAEQVGAAVAHEALGRREVVDQEAERGTGGERSQHSGLLAVQIEGDHRHRRGDDRADARRQAIDAIGEVDDVHHHDEPEHGHQGPGVGDARVWEVQQPDERQRDRLHRDSVVHDDHRRHDLAGELHGGRKLEAVVERPDEGDHRGRQQHAMPQLVIALVAAGQPDQRRDERSGEDRQSPEQRRGTLRQAPLARLVDRADGPREAHREWRQQRGHARGDEKGVKRVELVRMRHRLAHSIAGLGVGKRLRADGGPVGGSRTAGCQGRLRGHAWRLAVASAAGRQLRLDLSDGFKRRANDDQQ